MRWSPATPATVLLPLLAAACTSPESTMQTPPDTATGAPVAADAADPHSCARPQEVAVRHIALDLLLDFDRKLASGTCTLDLVRTVASAPLWLDTQDLGIRSVIAADTGAKVTWRLLDADPQLGRPLRIDLPADCARITIDYATAPGHAAAMQWLQPEQTSGKKPFLFTQGQAILTRSWIPLQDSPAVRATWQATIRAPAGLRPLMSAVQSGGDAHTGWTFAMDRPVPSYLIALACGDLQRREISDRCAVWAEPAVVERAAAELEDMEHMVSACETVFGPYRWGRYDVLILPPSFPFGGMENPCMTFATPTILAGDKSLVNLIAHELSHSWSGNLVTNATWRDFWLNEGFTVFLEHRIMEHVFGKERAQMEIALGMRDLAAELRTLHKRDQVLHIDLRGRNPDDGMTTVPYEKGAAFLRRLEQIYGRERFDAFLRGWFDAHAFQSVTTATFRDWLQQRLLASDPQLAAQIDVDAWLEGDGIPGDAPVPTAQAFAVVDEVKAAVQQQRSAAPLAGVTTWSTQQWLRFLDGMKADAALLAELDAARGFTKSGNCEILMRWLQLAIAADYAPALPRLEQFLLDVGRRKYLKPLYEALLQARDGRARARAIYAKARPRYHAVAVRTLDELLQWQGQ